MQSRPTELDWEDFSTARVEELRAARQPILIDFTADWCGICITNEAFALNRPATIRFAKEHGIVTLKADFTHQDPEIARWLDVCKQNGVPLTLIFPRGRPDEAIPLRGLYSQSALLAQLEYAVTPEEAGTGPETIARPATGETTTALPVSMPAAESVTSR
jgi:thiol:disulfide interchange protein DsbD